MKNGKRLIADLILAIALGLCMAYAFTGGLIHEILGMAMLIGILVHLIRRRKYYKSDNDSSNRCDADNVICHFEGAVLLPEFCNNRL